MREISCKPAQTLQGMKKHLTSKCSVQSCSGLGDSLSEVVSRFKQCVTTCCHTRRSNVPAEVMQQGRADHRM